MAPDIGGIGPGFTPPLPGVGPDAGGIAGAPPVGPRGDDVAAFDAAMGQQDAPPTIEAPPVADTPPAEMSPGDQAADAVGKLGRDMNSSRDEAMAILNNPNATQADLIRAQMAMTNFTTLTTLATKTVEKVTQGVKTLQQG